jgi:PAS domain S-box-containing protein
MLVPLGVAMKEGKIPSRIVNQDLKKQKDISKTKILRRRYADFFEFAPIGYFIFDRAGIIHEANSAGAMLLGTDKNTLLNQHFSQFISQDSRDAFELHSRRLFASRTKQTCDVKTLNNTNKDSWVQLESVAVQNGSEDPGLFLTVINDITDRKKAEEALREAHDKLEQRVSERTAALEEINKKLRRQIFECELAEAALKESELKYSSLVEDALIGVYIIKDSIIEFANDKFAAIYGYEKSELIGMESLALVHPEDRAMIKEMREKRLKGEKVPSEYEIRGLKKNGDAIWVMRSFSLINYKDGPAISGIVSDMTKRRKAEDALRESGKELRILSNQLLSMEEKERKRIAGELHDSIGQALSAIKFSVENSLRQLRNTPEQSELKSLEAVIPLTQKTIEEVRRIVKDLRPSILDDLGILATITWFCREFQKVYASIRIKIETDIQEDAIPSALKTVIYRIMQEALNNVAKHSSADLIQLTLKKTDNRIKFIIADNGVGFDLAKAISLNPSRRGFGLASMRERAELSGATFDINSSTDTGSCIRVVWEG